LPYTLSDDLNNYITLLSNHLRIKKPTLFVSSNALIPYTKGFLSKIIVFPLAYINQLTTAEFEAILLHEIAHIKRNDIFWNWFLQLAKIVHSLNPFAQLLIEQSIAQREFACDDWVVQQSFSNKIYAQTLFKIANWNSAKYTTQLQMASPQFHLLNRIKRLFEPNAQLSTSLKWKWMPLLLLGLFLKKIHKEAQKSPIIERVQVANKNELLLPLYFGENDIKNEPLNKRPNAEIATCKEVEIIKNDTLVCAKTDMAIIAVANQYNTMPLISATVNNNFYKSNQAIFELKDSINLYNAYVSNQSVTDLTSKSLESILQLISENEY
jgi:hypothetical protein